MAERDIEQALAWANAEIQHPTRDWHGLANKLPAFFRAVVSGVAAGHPLHNCPSIVKE